MLRVSYLLLYLLCLSGCTCVPSNYPVAGPDEFVMDSYRIAQGKTAILEMMGKPVGELPSDAMKEYRDEIGEGDILTIALYHPSRKELREAFDYLNQAVGGFPVTEGKIRLPDMEPIKVSGLTLMEAQDLLRQEIQKHYQDAELFISYRNRKQKRVELTGMVNTPSVAVDGKMRLYELISAAGFRPEANLFMSYVMRDGKALPVDLHKLILEGDLNQNIVMKGGDKVFIAPPYEARVLVLGEVMFPKMVNLPYGYLSLTEVLASAGGIKDSGDLCHLFVIRGDLQCPKIYDLTWQHVLALPSTSLLLMPGDTVYVARRPISQWNKFVSDLIPTLNVINSVKDAKNVFLVQQ